MAYIEEEMLESLKELASRLGRTPKVREVMDAYDSGMYIVTPQTYVHRFGSYNNALLAANLPRRHVLRTRNELILDLRDLSGKLGRSPKTQDINEAHCEGKCACASTYILRFGSLDKARIEAGVEIS